MIDPAESESRTVFRRLGAISVLLGALSLIRLALELIQTRDIPSPPSYFAYTGYDGLQAFAACASGAALLRRHRWAMPLCTITAIALFLTSAMVFVEHGEMLLNVLFVLGMNENLHLWSTLGSRVFLTGIHLVYWPIVFGHVYIDLQCRNPAEPGTRTEKRRFWIWTGATALGCAGVELFIRTWSQIPSR